jgi:hypothetical protein
MASGIWGSPSEEGRHARGRSPLGALVELGRGPGTVLLAVPAETALRPLIHATLVPASSTLVGSDIGLPARLTTRAPVYRMEWSPASPPWTEIAALVREELSPGRLRPPAVTSGSIGA